MNTKWTETTKYTVIVALGLVLVWLIWIARPLIGPVVISALLAFTLNPLVTWLCNRTRMNHNIAVVVVYTCLLYTSPSPRDGLLSRMPSSA